jgi:MraZ protein
VTFYGTYEHSVDDRGRLAIPARYRHSLADGAVLRSSPDGCVELYSSEGFEAEVQLRLGEERSTRGAGGRRIRRAFLPGAFDVELDRQGRVLLPQGLRGDAALDDRAVIVGCGDYVEIWNPDRWNEALGTAADEDAAAAAGGAS